MRSVDEIKFDINEARRAVDVAKKRLGELEDELAQGLCPFAVGQRVSWEHGRGGRRFGRVTQVFGRWAGEWEVAVVPETKNGPGIEVNINRYRKLEAA